MQKRDAIKKIEYYCEKDSNSTCPISNCRCKKLSRSDIGICSFIHLNRQQIICPFVFEKSDFRNIVAKEILESNDYKTLKEVKIGNNYIDFVLVDTKDSKNYCGIEVQALDTSGNYRWLFNEDFKPFCINWKTTTKTIISQLITKVPIFKKFSKKLVLVIQDSFAKYLNIDEKHFDENDDLYVYAFSYKDAQFVNYNRSSLKYEQIIQLLNDNNYLNLNNTIESLLKK